MREEKRREEKRREEKRREEKRREEKKGGERRGEAEEGKERRGEEGNDTNQMKISRGWDSGWAERRRDSTAHQVVGYREDKEKRNEKVRKLEGK